MTTQTGGQATDFIAGTAGNDTLSGDDGNDLIFGGAGDDVITDGAGDDTLVGGPGNDFFDVVDNNGAAAIPPFPPDGSFPISGGPGVDTLNATAAIEAIVMGADVFAAASVEVFVGSANDDSIDGSEVDHAVTMDGQAGDDTLVGGSANDTLTGGAGEDSLRGNGGADVLTGNEGSDRFEYKALTDSLLGSFDVIVGLEIGTDEIVAPNAIAAGEIFTLGPVAALDEASVAALLNAKDFRPSEAAAFRFEDRTFLALNDGIAGFQAEADAVIEITGFTGSLDDLSIQAIATPQSAQSPSDLGSPTIGMAAVEAESEASSELNNANEVAPDNAAPMAFSPIGMMFLPTGFPMM